MSKSIKKNLAYNILRNISNIIFPLVTAPYISRVLEPEGVGLFNFASTYAGYFALVAVLGIPNYGMREISKRRDDKSELSTIFSELFSISVITTAIVSFFYLLSIFLVGQLNDNLLIFFLAGAALYLSPFNIDWIYSGLEQFGYITLRSIIIKTLSIIAMFLFVRSKDDVFIYVILNVAATSLNQIWNFIILHKIGVRIKLAILGLKKHIKPLLLLFSSAIAISLYTTLNTILLGFMSTYDQVAFYNSANYVSRAFLAIVTSMSEVMVPRLSLYGKDQNWDAINGLLKKSFSAVSFVAVPVAIGLITIAHVFLPLFLGDKFEGAVLPLQIMALIVVVIGYNNIPCIQILLGLGFDKLLLYSVLWGSASNILLNVLLIPYFGAVGTAVASVIAETIILVVSFIYVKKKTKVKISGIQDLAKSIIGGLLMIISYFALRYVFEGWYLVFIYTAVCGIVFFLSQYLLKSESMQILNNIVISKFKKNE